MNLGTGDYTEQDQKYWKSMQVFYANNTVNKSARLIKVDFKNKEVLTGTTQKVKKAVNNYYNKVA